MMPTDADIEEVVEEFEVHAFAGLKKRSISHDRCAT